MRSIDSDLKTGQFKQLYLLYGPEAYLVRWYKHLLTKALLPEADEMNFTILSGKGADESVLIETAGTLPFFAQRRVILLEKTGMLEKKSKGLEELFSDLPETTFLIFVEESVDKRKALYKKIAKDGCVEEFTKPDENSLTHWMLKRIGKAGLSISKTAWRAFLLRSGDSMDNMKNEMDKLIAYCAGQDAIRIEDVDAICTSWMEGRIFDMLDAIASRDIKKTLALYRDMLLLHESPEHILAIMRIQFERLLLLKEMDRHREGEREIALRTKIPAYYLGKNRRLAANFTTRELEALLIEAGNLDADMKTGRINKQIGLEMLLTKYALSDN